MRQQSSKSIAAAISSRYFTAWRREPTIELYSWNNFGGAEVRWLMAASYARVRVSSAGVKPHDAGRALHGEMPLSRHLSTMASMYDVV